MKKLRTQRTVNCIPMNENEISNVIIGQALKIHKKIGPGLLESAYEKALAHELIESGLHVKRQVSLPFIYKNVRLKNGYHVDMIVENKVIVEIKSSEGLLPVHYSQLLTYLRLADLKLGLLINFNNRLLKGHIHRVVNNL
jgi:GxxExxY protein